MGPLEEKEGYGKNYSVAVNVASAPVGMLIPPSNTMIVYSTVAGSVSIAALFMAGYIPGIIWGAGVIILATTAAKRLGYRSSSELTLKIALKTFWQAVPSLLMIVIVIGGILGGMSDGSPIIVRAYVKPTPSIFRPQQTVNRSGENTELTIRGRHDPIIVPRAVVVMECMTAITVLDAMMMNMSAKLDSLVEFYR